MNLQKMMKQAQAMQDKISEVQANVEAQEFEGVAGSGMVKVRINGKNRALNIAVDDSLMQVGEKDMLEDLLVAAFNDARDKMDETQANEMSKVTSGMGLPPGMKLPF